MISKEVKINPGDSGKATVARSRRFLIAFICIFLALLIAFGATFGTIIAIRNAKTVAKYGQSSIDSDMLAFLAPYYKYKYVRLLGLSGVSVTDDEAFWNSEAEDGKTYGQLLSESFREFVSSLLISASLYDARFKYGREERAKVKDAANAILDSISDGNKRNFNQLCEEKYGFNYKGMLAAIKYLYKSNYAQIALYGTDGSGIAQSPDDCEQYLATYSHVDLIFIRLEDVIERDESGNIKYDSNNNAVIRDLTASERTERQQMVERLSALVSGSAEGEQITPETFDYYMQRSDGDKQMYDIGYYFHRNAEKTAEFAEVFPEVVEAALEMEIGEYREVECDEIRGVCFIYKYGVANDAYINSSNVFFSDFYSDAANYIYPIKIESMSIDVEFRDGFDAVDITSVRRVNSNFNPSI